MTFTCEECGIKHNHSRERHHVGRLDSVPDEYVERMKYDPACNCGWKEAQRDVLNGNLELSNEDENELLNTFRAVPNGLEDELRVL